VAKDNLLMNMLHNTLLICLLISFLSCSNRKITDDDIAKFILKYQNESFDDLKGISVFQRDRTISKIVFGVGKYAENKPPYFVEFNTGEQSITKINRSLLQKDNVSDYLSKIEIENAVKTIRKHEFFLLAVDSSGNVYVNPFYYDAPAFLLRLKKATGDSIVRKGYVYKLYKNNWYINRRD